MKLLLVFAVVVGSLALVPATMYAHPGNTDKYGCHTCRINCPKWGLSYSEYHCHRAKALPQPLEPVRSSANGITVPAPDYKVPASIKKVKSVPVKGPKKVESKKRWFSGW